MSQLELALQAGASQRHLSFLESETFFPADDATAIFLRQLAAGT